MGSKPIALLASAAGGASLYPVLPLWCVITLVLTAVSLTAIQAIVTQIIRLRASNMITSSSHALLLLEFEDDHRSRDK
jgi:hypothetical protein